MKRFFRGVLRVGLLLVFLLLALPFIVPLDMYKPDVQARLSAASGHYVMIDSLKMWMLPAPELSATGITIWDRRSGGDEITIRRMDIIPDLARLIFEQQFAVRGIRIEGVEATIEFVAQLAAAIRSGAGAPSSVAVERIDIASCVLRAGDTAYGPFLFGVRLTPEFDVASFSAAYADHSVQIDLEREAGGYRTAVSARDWTPPAGPALHFDTLEANGRLQDGRLELARIAARGYGGSVAGGAALSWRDGWTIEARLAAADIALEPIVELFGGAGFAGDFSGTLDVALAAAHPDRLLTDPRVSGDFSIAKGSITPRAGKPPAFVFERLSARGWLSRTGLDAADLHLSAYGGTIAGAVRTVWLPAWRIAGELSAQTIDIEQLLAGIVDNRVISGRFQGEAQVALAAGGFRALLDEPAVTGRFRIADGVFYKADLEQASTQLAKSQSSNGQTPFEELSGETVISAGGIRITNLKIVSSALKAKGTLAIDKDNNLKGEMEVGLRNTASLISIPLLLSGTTGDPHLRPTGSAMVGGMVGTSVLGPGVGTAIGIKIGKIFRAIGSTLAGKGDAE